jgi:hypothetical protein
MSGLKAALKDNKHMETKASRRYSLTPYFLIGIGSFILSVASIFWFSAPHFLYALFLGLAITLAGVYLQSNDAFRVVDKLTRELAGVKKELAELKDRLDKNDSGTAKD